MKRTLAFLAAIALCAVSSVHADYSVTSKGTWPQSWPKELEPLRKQASTYEGPLVLNLHYAIPFTKQAEFESAWPYILKVKSKGTSIRLMRGPNFFLGTGAKAGVVIHCPPADQENQDPISIDVIVDGDIVDLNRVPLPADTPIIDDRFRDRKNN